jgi:signal peptide peptidase SppA
MNESILTEMQTHKWAMEPTALKAFMEKVSSLSSSVLVTSISVEMPKKTLKVINGVAKINISGVLLKTVPGWVKFFGINATGYDEIINQVTEAISDPSVGSIEITVSSPGGMVSGVEAAGDSIFNADKIKPVTAIVEDLAASGAYWLTSQARNIAANKTSEIGSIGVYSVYYDWTKFEEKMGIKAIVIRSGEHKGMGLDAITDSQVAAVQEVIDGLAVQFIESVARGRKKEVKQINDLATGKLWLAEDAKKLGLIDNIQSQKTDTNVNPQQQQADKKNVNPNNGELIMDDKEIQTKVDQAAETAKTKVITDEKKRLTDLKSAFPKDLAFALEQYEAGSTVTEAKAAYADVLQKRIDEKEKKSSGTDPLNSGDSQAAGGGENFIQLGKQMAKEQGIPLGQAYKKLAKDRPELHAAYKASLGL